MHRILQIIVLALSFPVYGFEAFEVSDIRVEGLQRISPGTVFNFLTVQVGGNFTEHDSELTIRSLYKSGYFRDIRLERDGSVLVVVVQERPAVASIKVQGNDYIETEPLLESLKDIGLAEGNVFDRSLLEKVELELERQYYSRGKYGVKITSTVSPQERNRVALDIEISEGLTALIKQINIIGNEVFSDSELRSEMVTKQSRFFRFFSASARSFGRPVSFT